ncbi:hypothetical protein FJ976_24075 [Mesorhizobium sp. B1-1-9]|uniref:hypothetical protein n=1 Tax=Mesorhizobium sp. B1-1-9 TaxID=2589975 RepID=UPI00112E252B|nr:hypothetical protein [Mesorhizobium sp. B1-1-9]TPN45315.1 hypothetical protein FJ976_24075 [Mesorhizobium sp. B1-1-9]
MAGLVGFATGNIIPGSARPDTTKAVEPVSADGPFSVSKVLGRSIPIVIGTGKVDGAPVIGGAVTVSTSTAGSSSPGVGGITGFATGPTLFGGQGTPATTTTMVPTSSTQQTAQLGYLLAFDPFGDGYELIRLEVNDKVVFDAENGIGASTVFRFYGGTQTEADPITKAVIGAKAGAWQGYVMLFLDGYVADSAPTVKAVISNAATETGLSGEIAWMGPAPSGVLDAFPHGSAYDPAEGVIYQVLQPTDIPGLSHIYLAVLDVDTLEERYRIPLQGSEAYAVGRDVIDYQLSVPIAMNASGLIFIQLSGAPATPRLTGVWDTATGHLVASYVDTVNMLWLTSLQFGQKWVFFGESFDDDPNCMAAVFDPATASLAVANILPDGPSTYVAVKGRVTTGFISFFSATASFTGDADIYELKFDGDAWTAVLVASLTGLSGLSVSVLWFDPLTGYLVVRYGLAGPINRWAYIDPETGSVVDTFDTSLAGYNVAALIPTFHSRLISRPGHVLMLAETDYPHFDIYDLDIQEKSISTFVSGLSAPDATRMSQIIVDQNRATYISATGEYVWTVNRQPSTIPGEVSVRWMITKIMSLAGYTPDDLTFVGFGPPDDGGDPDPDPGGDPEDALVALNFLTEVYSRLGVSLTAADVIDKPDRVGARGLAIPFDDVDGIVSAIGDFLADLLTMNWTVIIEWEELTTDSATYLLYLAGVDDDPSLVIERSTAFTGLRVDAKESSFNIRYVEINTSHGPGVHKIAFTRTDDFISMSCDGSDVVTQVVAPIGMGPMATATFGGDDQSYNDTFIRKVFLLAPADDADLAGLSTVV